MRKSIASAVFVLLVALASASVADASVIYYYQGGNFTSVTGSNPEVTTSDSITGWVEFATAPTPNETGKNDWIAYSLSDGARTLSSANGDHQFFNADFFDFDAQLNIVAWAFSVVPDSETDNGNAIFTSTAGDSSRLDGGIVQRAIGPSGSWSSPTPAPEPASLFLFGSGFGAALMRLRRRKA